MIFANKSKKKVNKPIKKNEWRMDVVFCLLMLSGLLLTLLALLATRGRIFPRIFFRDSLDTGMDFLHGIEYTRGRVPYEVFYTLYPPLANFLFYLLFRMVPSWQYVQWADTFKGGVEARGSSADLRLAQPTMIMLLVFIMFISALFILLVERILSQTKSMLVGAVALCMLFSYGVLFAVERGNIILLSLLGIMFFVFNRNSENHIIRELALILLAFSAGLKLYPAVFGILLIYDKCYKDAARAILYGIAFFVLPIFIFREGLKGFTYFFPVLFSFASNKGVISASGFSFDKIVTAFALGIDHITQIGLNKYFFLTILPKFNIFVVLLLLFFGFFTNKEWERTLVCCLAFLLFSDQGAYILSFFLIPLLGLIREEKIITNQNKYPFIFLTGTQILLPILNNNLSNDVSLFYLRFQVCIVALSIYIFFVSLKNIKSKELM